MSSTEVKLVFTATFKVSGEYPIENAIERARAEYGNEVADYGSFTIEEEEVCDECGEIHEEDFNG